MKLINQIKHYEIQLTSNEVLTIKECIEKAVYSSNTMKSHTYATLEAQLLTFFKDLASQ